MFDLTELTLEQLGHLRMQIDDLLAIKRAQRVANARRDILVIAKDAGLPLTELIKGEDNFARPMKTSIRIEHPSVPGVAWTGRGRYPNWMKELLAGGKSIDELKST